MSSEHETSLITIIVTIDTVLIGFLGILLVLIYEQEVFIEGYETIVYTLIAAILLFLISLLIFVMSTISEFSPLRTIKGFAVALTFVGISTLIAGLILFTYFAIDKSIGIALILCCVFWSIGILVFYIYRVSRH